MINVLFKFDIIMFKPQYFFLYPMLVKHIHSSGQVTFHSVLVSDAIDSHGTRLVQYPNGAEVPISEERFVQLELAQPDLSTLNATPLPEEITRFNLKH